VSEPGRWWRRRPRLAVGLAVVSPLLLAGLLLGGRALLVVLSIPSRADYWDARAEQPGDTAYIALGDSLTQGVGSSSPATSFVSVLAEDLAVRSDGTVRVVNLSVTGATTAELVQDQLPALEQTLRELRSQGVPVGLVTLCIGSNDAGSTSPEQYRRDLATVLDALPPGTYVTDVPDFNGGPRREAAAALAAVAREEVLARDHLVLVPLERYTADQDLGDYAADFFHPSDSGYERYVQAFRDTIAATEEQ
jgi:acyl-CoA thioesterase-1